MSWKPKPSDIEWTRRMIDGLNDGGVWAIPNNRSIWRLNKLERTFVCIHGTKDFMYQQLESVCKHLGYTVALKDEKMTKEQVDRTIASLTFGADQSGTGKTIEATSHKAPEKKFLCRPLTPEDLATFRANLAMLPKDMLWKGRTEPQCDFCAHPVPAFCYAASETTSGEKIDCWRWLACVDCHAEITRNDFDALEKRSAKNLSDGMDGKTAQFAIKLALMKFHKQSIPA